MKKLTIFSALDDVLALKSSFLHKVVITKEDKHFVAMLDFSFREESYLT